MTWYLILAWLVEVLAYFVIPAIYSLHALKTSNGKQSTRWVNFFKKKNIVII
jgi:hypothetical protein